MPGGGPMMPGGGGPTGGDTNCGNSTTCYLNQYDNTGMMTGSKQTCAKKGERCPCNSKWENECAVQHVPMPGMETMPGMAGGMSYWCQGKSNGKCPVNCKA